jgi:hypothetical protein
MPDEKKIDPFKPNQPTIPGISSAKTGATGPKSPYSKGLPTWLVLTLSGVLFVIIVGLWWSRRVPPEQAAPPPVVDTPAPDTAPAKPVENLPLGPGPVATTDELAKPWSSKRFLFKNTTTNDTSPAVVVHLPNGIYWGVSLREPFGVCEMEYVSDLKKLQTDYKFRADHPMVGDPCNHAVFDLMRYGSGPNGLVRGEIVSGAAVRPPLAIEILAQDKKVVAVRME